jgi:integrase
VRPDNDLGRAIAHLRGRRTQAAVSEVGGVAPGVWSLWETGARVPKEGTLARIVAALGCSRLELEEAVWRLRRQRLAGSPMEDRSAERAGDFGEVLPFAERATPGQEEATADPLRQELRPVIQRLAAVLEDRGLCRARHNRRGFITALLEAGVDVFTVQRLAGHADAVTTARYDRRGEGARRQAAQRLALPAA